MDVFNNTLAILIINELDNMAALPLFNFMLTNQNKVTNDNSYMRVDTSDKIEWRAGFGAFFIVFYIFLLYYGILATFL